MADELFWLRSGLSDQIARRRVFPKPQNFTFLPIWPTVTVDFPLFVPKGCTESLAIFGSLGIIILVTIVPLMLVRWF